MYTLCVLVQLSPGGSQPVRLRRSGASFFPWRPTQYHSLIVLHSPARRKLAWICSNSAYATVLTRLHAL